MIDQWIPLIAAAVVSLIAGIITGAIGMGKYIQKKSKELMADMPDPDGIDEEEILD